MAFKKPVTIYESEKVKVRINQCHAFGRKTRIFAVRRDDQKGLAHLLGSIEWNGAWRQYVFKPDEGTLWSGGCLEGIIEFLALINKEERAKWRRNK